MPSTISLIKSLRTDYPQFIYMKASSFQWSHNEHTIYYTCENDDCTLLFHELSHALLNHAEYNRDIELIAIERDAWDKSKEIAANYGVIIDDDYVQSNLDTYRDWLHARSTCPKCSATGLQTDKHSYKCLACSNQWRTNDAKVCALRRYNKKAH